MTGRPAARLQGDDLVQAILGSMEAGHNRIRGKTIVPAIYRIYLNPEDHAVLRDIAPFVVAEIRAALDDSLANLNGANRLLRGVISKIGLDRNKNEFVRIPGEWTVEIHPDADDTLQPGEIEVVSELGSPEKADYGAGSQTRRILPKSAEAAVESPTLAAESAPVQEAEVEKPDTDSTRRTTPSAPPISEDTAPTTDPTSRKVLATIRYTDNAGPNVLQVTKDQIMVGRGGRSYWVDVRLDAPTDVSREHCRIRHEAGRFLLEDLSQYGTKVNGVPVEKDRPVTLPDRATIRLAEVIDLEWETA